MDQPQDRPWTEAQWERFMYEADIRTARYGDLLETFMDDPHRDEIINREMGWNHDEAPLEIPDGACLSDDSREDSLEDAAVDDFGSEVGDEVAGSDEDDDLGLGDSKRKIPAYAQAFDWGLRVHRELDAHSPHSEDPEPDDPWVIAYGDSLVVAAKLAGGNGMNRDGSDDTLCANIVYCKKALAAATNAVGALETLRAAGSLPHEIADSLLSEGCEVRRVVEERIAELRARVWWE